MPGSWIALIVNDEIGACRLFEIMLNRMGFQTIIAHDGIQGLQAYLEFHPRLIITDDRMPQMDGLEMTALIRQQQTEPIPFIVLTTCSLHTAEEIEVAVSSGINDLWHMPIFPREFTEFIQRVSQSFT